MDKKFDIFISYSRIDWDVVKPFFEELKVRGFKVWLDTSNIDYGVSFTDYIAQALDDSDTMLFFCTKNSVYNSAYCKKELAYARTNGMNITAILVDGYMPKKGWFALEYKDINCVNLSVESQRNKLIETLEDRFQPERARERRAKIAQEIEV